MRRLALGALLAASCVHIAPHPIAPADTAAAFESRTLDPSQTWDLRALTDAALRFHPDLDLARAHAAVMRAAIETAAQRPDPAINASVEHKSEPNTSPWITSFGFDATIETANKRGLRTRIANDAARAADFAIADQAWQIRSGVRAQLVALAAAERSIDDLERQRALEDEIVDIFAKRLAAGEGAQPDVARARVAARQTALLLRDRRAQAATARARLAAAVGIPLSALPARPVFDLAAIPPITGTRAIALTQRPDILGALADYAQSESALRLELAKQYPDLHIGPGFGWDQGFARWSLAFSAQGPLLSRNRGPIAEAEARRKESEARFVSLQAKVIGALDEADARLQQAKARLEEADAVIALDRQRADAVRHAFDAGQEDRLALRSAELELQSAVVARIDALAEVQAAVGAVEDAMQQEAK